MKTIFTITLVGFIAGIFVGFGGYFYQGGFLDTVAEINGKKIPFKRFHQLYMQALESMRDRNEEITDEITKRLKDEVLQEILQDEIFYQESQKYNIIVTDEEVAYNLAQMPAFQENGKFSKTAYFYGLRRLRMTPAEFEEHLRRKIAISKLRNFLVSNIKITPLELQLEYKKHLDKPFDEFEKQFYMTKINAVFNEWFKQLNSSLKAKIYSEKIEKAF